MFIDDRDPNNKSKWKLVWTCITHSRVNDALSHNKGFATRPNDRAAERKKPQFQRLR